MCLSDVKLNADCVVEAVNILDDKIKIRLMELGLIEGVVVRVFKRSVLKKTLLLNFNSMCFTLKDNLAREIEVKYA